MPVTPPPITPVPMPVPQRGDRATFSDRVDAFVTWLENAPLEFEAVAQNVYDNAFIAEGSGDVATVGLGIISDGPHLANIDNGSAISAFWTVDATTTGTFPTGGARNGMVINKIYDTRGFQLFAPAAATELWYRIRNASAWGSWVRIDNKVSRSGDTLSGDITLAYGQPKVIFNENDQAGGTGYWRLIADVGTWRLDMNTSAARDFATYTATMTIDSSGYAVTNGNVRQGGGAGQGVNRLYLGWGSSGGGLKCQVDSTDQGYIPFSSTNPSSSGTITYANPLTAQAASFTTVSASGLLSANAGLQVNGSATLVLGGAAATLANNGYFQIGGAGGLNIVADNNNIQARNNGAATTLNLNSLGGPVQAGAGGFTTSGAVFGANIVTDGQVRARYTGGDDKIVLMEGGSTTRGYITAAAGHCFGAVNAAHTLQALICDNSGNFTAAGNITANSDERIKTNWRNLPEDFLERLADIALLGLYDRTDIDETQIGMSAQEVQAFAPELVNVCPITGLLSLDYGKLGAVSGALLARRNRQQRKRMNELEAQVQALISKVGGV